MRPETADQLHGRPVSYHAQVLDVLIVCLNLFAGARVSTWVVGVIRDAPSEAARGVVVGLFMLGMLALPACAAVLKRRRTHARLAEQARREGLETMTLEPGCLFNPIVYLCVNLVLGCGVVAGIGPLVFGGDLMERGGVFVPLILLVIVGAVAQTGVVYRYFTPLPAAAAPSRFLASPAAAALGDACIYLNTLLFQVVWLTVSSVPFERVGGVGDTLGRVFFITFAALLVYFPPRMLYLVEDLRRPSARLTLVAANAAMVYRLFVGTT